jgi:hypothetical protein
MAPVPKWQRAVRRSHPGRRGGLIAIDAAISRDTFGVAIVYVEPDAVEIETRRERARRAAHASRARISW